MRYTLLYIITLAVCILHASLSCLAQDHRKQVIDTPTNYLTIGEYNVENLFDSKHDSLKNDYSFMPEGEYRWTNSKYWNKLNAIARSIVSMGTWEDSYVPTDIIALCEVENDSVMHALTKRSLLRGARYEYFCTSSPDVRGIDVALLYSPFAFMPTAHYPIAVDTIEGMRPTRHILYVKGTIANNDSIHVFAVHAPSRRGGENITRAHRMQVVKKLEHAIDSIRMTEQTSNIVVMGDFNDYSDSPSIKYLKDIGLHDISENATGRNGAKATYRYQGTWRSLDHILVSSSMKQRLITCDVCDDRMLLETDTRYGGVRPKRFINGIQTQDGFSDHLPLLSIFKIQ